MIKSKILLALLAGTLSLTVAAESDIPDGRWLLAKYDANGDRVISSSEIEHKRQRVFAHMDENADGDVSFAEYQSLDNRKREAILQARFAKLDADNDGRLTGQEYASYLGSFERLDQNGDGQVTRHEISPKRAEKTQVKPEADLCLLWVCVRKNPR